MQNTRRKARSWAEMGGSVKCKAKTLELRKAGDQSPGRSRRLVPERNALNLQAGRLQGAPSRTVLAGPTEPVTAAPRLDPASTVYRPVAGWGPARPTRMA